MSAQVRWPVVTVLCHNTEVTEFDYDWLQLIIRQDMSCSILCVDTGVQTKWPPQQKLISLASVPSAGRKHNWLLLMSKSNSSLFVYRIEYIWEQNPENINKKAHIKTSNSSVDMKRWMDGCYKSPLHNKPVLSICFDHNGEHISGTTAFAKEILKTSESLELDNLNHFKVLSGVVVPLFYGTIHLES